MKPSSTYSNGVRRHHIQPLWIRIERNRVRLMFMVGLFVLMAGLMAEVVLFIPSWILAVGVLVGNASGAMGDSGETVQWYAVLTHLVKNPGSFALAVGVLGAVVAVISVAWTLTRPLDRQLKATGAKFVALGELAATKSALKDMCIAAGVEMAPALWTLEARGVNALIVSRRRQRPICVVTTGFLSRLDPDEQRAVFANLTARLIAGDVMWATAVSALMSPVWRWRDADLARGHDDIPAWVSGDRLGPTHMSRIGAERPGLGALAGGEGLGLMVLWAFVAYMIAVLASEFVLLGHRRSHLFASEAADAEGMLLLKDPELMLRTLRRTIELDNTVRTNLPLYAGLFYIWAGDDATNEDDDPEWERVRHLREVVGTDGLADGREAVQPV